MCAPTKLAAMSRTADVVVVGGGVVGAACAYFLSLEGLRVHLVERQYFSAGASRASHGGLALMHSNPSHCGPEDEQKQRAFEDGFVEL